MDCKNRWSHHKFCLKEGVHCNPHLQRAWNKYGEQAFEFYIVLEMAGSTPEERQQAEKLEILKHKNHCFNINLEPGLNPMRLESVRLKMSATRKGKRHTEETILKMKGRIFTAEHRSNLRQAMVGKKLSEEHKRKVGVARTGKKHTEETKRRMSESHLSWHRQAAHAVIAT
jgi:hypothetical protein